MTKEHKRSLLDVFESAFDRIVGFFMPRREIYRRLDRQALRSLRSEQYAAAKTTRLTGDWNPVDSNVNDIIGTSWATVTARTRQLVRDFPYFARAVDILVDYTVGSGILFQSRVRDSDRKLNKALNQQIEDAFHFWADEADVSGKLHYYEMMALAKRQEIETGEFLFVKKYVKDSKRFIPFTLQMYEPDCLTSYGAVNQRQTEIDRGIEYDKETGAPIAYHFIDPDAWGKSIRVPASDVIHGFKTLRPGQMRGITPFAPGILVAKDLNSIIDSELDASKMASKYLGFVYRENPYIQQRGMDTDEDNKKIDEMENAIVEYLRQGEKIEIAQNPRPGNNFMPFIKLVLSMLCVTTGTPYELLSGLYEDLNFSSGRLKRNDFIHELRPAVTRHVRHYAMPTFLSFMESAVMAGKLDLPYFFSNPYMYIKAEWQPPGMELVDPSRETKSQIDQRKNLLRSPQEIAKARGRDLEDIYDEIAEAEEMAKEKGIKSEKTSTALANNPAALEEQDLDNDEEEENGKKTIPIQLIPKR